MSIGAEGPSVVVIQPESVCAIRVGTLSILYVPAGINIPHRVDSVT